MKTSEEGRALIKRFEGLRLKAYQCAAGVWTIGYGHTEGVYEGMQITQEQADDFLKEDLNESEKQVSKYNNIYKWTQCEFDALVSFQFNTGKIKMLTDNGKRSKKEIANKLLEYNIAAKKVLPGLTDRRNAERELFLSDLSTSTNTSKSTNYTVGTYELLVNLNVRTGPGTEHEVKSYSQLTADGKEHAKSKNEGVLKAGTRVDVVEIIKSGSDVWGKIPSGYVALYYNQKKYATLVRELSYV